MTKPRNPSQPPAEPVRTVKLLVELGEAGNNVSRAVTVDLGAIFDGWKLDEIVRATKALKKQAAPPPERKPTPPAPPKAKLEPVLEPIDTPGIAPVRIQGEMIMGRSRLCDISIQSAKVSRRHFRIAAEDGGVVIEDLGSANHTWVNGQEVVRPTPLEDGDVVLAGDVSLRYRVVRVSNGVRNSAAHDLPRAPGRE